MHLIMFDIDGTLVNSYGFDEACYLKAAQIVLGVEISSDWEEYSFATDAGILDETIDRYNVSGDRTQIHQKFRKIFTRLTSEHIAKNSDNVIAIQGAAQFIQYLINLENVKVAIATGGWENTARLKLNAANINVDGCAFASCSDHNSRTGIMTVAESRVSSSAPFTSKTYFGDASWDKEASRVLDYKFVLVGKRIEHEIQINDFQDKGSILRILDL